MSYNTIYPRNGQDKKSYVEKRRKDDWITITIKVIGIVGWVFIIAILSIVDSAKPGQEDWLTRLTGAEVSHHWNLALLPYGLFLLIFVLVVTVFGIIFNRMRHRRKTDRYNISVIILCVGSFIGLIYYIIRFGELIF